MFRSKCAEPHIMQLSELNIHVRTEPESERRHVNGEGVGGVLPSLTQRRQDRKRFQAEIRTNEDQGISELAAGEDQRKYPGQFPNQ